MRAAELLRRLRQRAARLEIRHEEIPGKGSHLKIWHGEGRSVVPVHRGDLPRGTLLAILR
jgi:predicted RNA binding protein YcfA (HicA-like mRNA interferase family)